MDVPSIVSKIFFKRSPPRRSKSRRRKTLERKTRPGKIVEADRRSPFMTVMRFPKTEDERREIEEKNVMTLAVLGTGIILPGFQDVVAKLEKEEASAG